MMTKRISIWFVLSGAFIHSLSASAENISDQKPQFGIGLKLWNSSWSSSLASVIAGVNGSGVPGVINNFEVAEGERRWDVIPTISMRYKDYFLSASYARFSTNFNLNNVAIVQPNGVNLLTARSDHLERTETDINGGYYVTQNIALTMTYKYGTVDSSVMTDAAPGVFVPLSSVKGHALLLGVLAAYPIKGRLGTYGQFAYGPGRLKYTFETATNNPPPGSKVTFDSTYLITELGVVYGLPLGSLAISNASVGLAYRSQTIKTKGDPIQGNRDLRDVRDGAVLSLNMTF
ncbi:MAG TPA: hypothetical protein VJ652_07255 [Noviherbaspirillum sp.]|nr:hypothetical protein [Noviherbaspirillum sp.]